MIMVDQLGRFAESYRTKFGYVERVLLVVRRDCDPTFSLEQIGTFGAITSR